MKKIIFVVIYQNQSESLKYQASEQTVTQTYFLFLSIHKMYSTYNYYVYKAAKIYFSKPRIDSQLKTRFSNSQICKYEHFKLWFCEAHKSTSNPFLCTFVIN